MSNIRSTKHKDSFLIKTYIPSVSLLFEAGFYEINATGSGMLDFPTFPGGLVGLDG